MKDILIYLYYAVHMAAAVLELFLYPMALEVQRMGPAAWGLSVLWLGLLALEWSGRVNLHGPAAKTLSALVLPAAGGAAGQLCTPLPGTQTPAAAWSCCLLLLLLLGSILLRPPERAELPPVRAAAERLDWGSGLAILIGLWLLLLAGAVFLMATVGFLFTLILGRLIASRNSLLDYGGLCGTLFSLLALYLLQVALYWRGFQLARLAGSSKRPGLSLVIPVWNARQARCLRKQLQAPKEGK